MKVNVFGRTIVKQCLNQIFCYVSSLKKGSSIICRVILINQSSVEMVNFNSVTRKSKQKSFKTKYHALARTACFKKLCLSGLSEWLYLRQYPVHQRRKWPSIKSMIGLQTIFSISRRGPTLKNLQDGKIPFDTIYHFTKSSRRFQTKAPESLLGGSLILKPLQVKNQGDGQQLETWNQWFKEETKQEQVLLQGGKILANIFNPARNK